MPERSGECGYRGLVPKGSEAVRGLSACAVRAALVVIKPKGREGERPREAKPRRARVP